MDFSFQNLKYFVAVAEEGSVTRAARRLFISQPSVSAAISHFESTLGQKLFVRRPSRGVILTPAGEQLLPRARALLAQADELQAAASHIGSQLSGTLRAACFVNLAPIHFAALLSSFGAKYPGISVVFRDGHQEDILDGVRRGLFEVAITFDLGSLEDFETTTLAELPPNAVLPVTHRLANRSSIDLEELAPEPLILMDFPLTREYFLSLFRIRRLKPRLEHLTKSFEMLRALAGNGLGYGMINVIPAITKTCDGKETSVVPLRPPVAPLHIVAIRLREMPLRAVSEAFLHHAGEFFAQRQSHDSLRK
ncbi:DNA-binding transcriptional LysR family regulator [Natronocella acetinitrilica]|uniref:DNA-binding transcriptional LysR family regulator n=1 Tax=Natronocella acetinitrilica TaxID=414046 RepID=A0AAE3G853_9GAMM|nr:LysR family transcriptional regulator [Natronocella acetinitrilica]MCP1676198.1 DNA-binding transcriptional LysR family regulator [Natronocella acetinitrilica]